MKDSLFLCLIAKSQYGSPINFVHVVVFLDLAQRQKISTEEENTNTVR